MSMFSGKEPHDIDPEKAKGLIKAWRADKASNGKAHGHFFGREAIEKLLAQEGCIGIRMYHARHDKGHETLVLVAADTDGRDMWKGSVAEEAWPCPPYCDPDAR